MTIESQTSDHHGGRHVAQAGPLPLPPAPKYSIQVLSSAFTPGMYSLVHHSGVEAVSLIEGEGCSETPTRPTTLRKGETLAIPDGTPMRAVVTGSTLRYVVRVIAEISRNAHWLIKTERRPASDPSAPHRQAYRARRKRSNPCCITSPSDVGWRSCW